MANLVDRYLQRLGLRLRKAMPAQVVNEHLQELEAHLRESTADFVRSGDSVDRAESLALLNLGSDRLVADGLIRTHSGIGALSTWRITWVPILIGLTYAIFPVLVPMFEPVPSWLVEFSLWLPSLFLAFFGYSSWRSRRLLAGPTALLSCAVFCSILAGFLVFSPEGITSISKGLRLHDERAFENLVVDLTRRIDIATETSKSQVFGSGMREDLSFKAPVWETVGNSHNIIDTPISIRTADSTTLNLKPTLSRSQAIRLWKANGPAYIEQLQAELTWNRIQRDQRRSFQLNGTTFRLFVIRDLRISATLFVLLFAFNLAILGISRVHRELLSRRWRPDVFA